jgi:Fe-S-cluster-containing hydrogenase component 2
MISVFYNQHNYNNQVSVNEMNSHDQDTVYHALRKEIDKMPVGMPKTESGVEIRILKRLFTPKEAQICLHLNILPEKVVEIHKRVYKNQTDLSIEQLEQILDHLALNGSIMRTLKDDQKFFSYAMFAIGMYEFQVDRLDKEFYQDCEEYINTGFTQEFNKTKIPQLRVVPVNKTIVHEKGVAKYDDIREIVQNHPKENFGVMNCICKQGKDLIDENCSVTGIRETCIIFPSSHSAFDDFGVRRAVSKEEILKILDEAEDAGLVLQPGNTQRPGFICCCCGDCCGVLSAAKQFPRPAEMFSSNYYAFIDSKECTACGTCLERCQMEAIIELDEYNEINLERCIGCGLCITTCVNNAVTLKQKENELVPPKSTRALYQKILMKKKGKISSLKVGAKIALRKKQ